MYNHRTLQMQKVRDFHEAFVRVLKLHPDMPFLEAYRAAAEGEAPRFYCEFAVARRFISLIHRKRPLPLRQENKKKMYRELYRRWKATGQSSYSVLNDIIMSPAPSFYIDHTTAQAFNHRYRR